MALLLLSTAPRAHVAMQFQTDQIGPIRNANGPTGNGRASVAGPCSGANAFGANGKGVVQDGATVTLNINYAAGHASAQNAFRMAFACGAPNENTMGGQAAVLTAADNACTGTAGGQQATYNDNGADGGIPAPNAIVDGGYDITCTLPLQNNAATEECTVALIDQRNWGGCVDVDLLPAAAALPPAPPPAPITPNAAAYRFLASNAIDTSAADFTCCPLAEGELNIPDDGGALAVTGTLSNVKASACRTTADTTSPATDELYISTQQVLLTKKEGTQNKYEGTMTLKGQQFDVAVENQVLTFAQNALSGEQPIVCDGEAYGPQAAVGNPVGSELTPGGGGGGSCGVDSAVAGASASVCAGFTTEALCNAATGCLWAAGLDGGAIAGIIIGLIVALALIGVCVFCMCKSSGKGGAPPPPPAPGGVGMTPAMPPGWTQVKDPNSGQPYYYNNQTGVTQWTMPTA